MLAELRAALGEHERSRSQAQRPRRYKTEEFIRIGLHDLGGTLEIVRCSTSSRILPKPALKAPSMLTIEELNKRFGAVPRGQFAVLGGGKMGGSEIDYNSDLDLVFIYDAHEDAQSRGGPQGNCRRMSTTCASDKSSSTYSRAPTEEGIAYKIDMQLRPSGKSGPLVCSLDAFREYHKTSSQLWERQALIKARFVAGDPALGKRLKKSQRTLLTAKD